MECAVAHPVSSDASPNRLKIVFDGELHDPWAHVGLNLAERAAVQGRIGCAARKTSGARIQKIRTVLDVERFSTNLYVLMFPYGESSGERNIDIEITRAQQIVGAHVAQSTRGRRGKRIRIDVAINRSNGAVGVRIYLVGALAGGVDVVQSAVHSGEDGEMAAAVRPNNRGELPVSSNPLQRPRRIVRRLKYGGEIEVLPNVNRGAVAAIVSPVRGIVVRTGQFGGLRIADAMRPSVIGQHGEVAGEPVFRGQNQRVVASRAAVIQVFQGAVIRSLRRIDLSKRAARLLVAQSGAGPGLRQAVLPRHAVTGDVNRRIQLLVGPQVSRVAAQITGFQQPTGS